MKILKEFREFAAKGNAIDLAVGVILGAGFNDIVNSLVDDIIMPPLGLLTGEVDFSQQKIVLQEATDEAAAISMQYGLFLNAVLEFIIIAFIIFLTVKYMNRLRREKQATAPTS